MSQKEQDEEVKVSDISRKLKPQRILSFKQKKPVPSLSLSNNLSLINTIAQEKTQLQSKQLRIIPQFPEKILDAPDLVDDYYLNLLDWS
jgi:cell division cycle protein 20 (cofactor of APC complex)